MTPGTLYVCATPIGNLEDITLRVLRILQEANFIAAEDTRRTLQLLNHYEIKTPLVSYHEHNKSERGPALLARLQNGESCALVSDAGMPGISDPGEDLVRLCIDNDIPVTVCPGATAAATAVVLSGLACGQYIFEGFLPHGKNAKKDRAKRIAALQAERRTVVFYESPYRIKETLSELLTALGDREAAAARELTKKFEEVRRGTLSELLDHFRVEEPKGEFVLVISGASESAASAVLDTAASWANLSIPDHAAQYIRNGQSEMDAIKAVAKERGLPKREVYAQIKINE